MAKREKVNKAVCSTYEMAEGQPKGCGATFALDKLKPISRLWERMDPFGRIPAGECPKCGGLAYLLVEDWGRHSGDLIDAAQNAWNLISSLGVGYRGSAVCGRLATGMDTERGRRKAAQKLLAAAADAFDLITLMCATTTHDGESRERPEYAALRVAIAEYRALTH